MGSGFFRCYFHVRIGFAHRPFRAHLCASLECLSDQILQSRTTSDKQYKFCSVLHQPARCSTSVQEVAVNHRHTHKNKKNARSQKHTYLMYLPRSIIYIPRLAAFPHPPLSLPLFDACLQQLFLSEHSLRHQTLAGFYRWQRASVGASWGRACTQPCRTEEEHIEIFKGNALALDGGMEVA